MKPVIDKAARRKAGFNFIAPWYDFFAGLFFAGSLFRAQTHFLHTLPRSGKVLVFGGGTGKILLELLRRKLGDRFVYLDFSRKMIAATQRRLSRAGYDREPVSFICGSVAEIPAERFDLIVTPFVLDCFESDALAEAMAKFAGCLAPGGLWLMSDFHIPKGVRGIPARAVIRTLYFAFNTLCALNVRVLPDFAAHFSRLGLKPREEAYFLRGMLVSRVYGRETG